MSISEEPQRLVDRRPEVSSQRLLAELVPPPRFTDARFATFVPDPAFPSQARAVERLTAAADGPHRTLRDRLRGSTPPGSGVYLDGGFGVGKTHLLASMWHATPQPRAFGTFGEFTQLVGVLGFRPTVAALSTYRLVCIDEFELDDPGDTVLMSTMLARLVEAGVQLAATSNTLPGSLGEGRFAAEDFAREIQALSSAFEVVRLDGEDYRHRGMPEPPEPLSEDQVASAVSQTPGATLDELPALLEHLAQVHPSRYGALLDGVTAVGWWGVSPVSDQSVALRLVALADRMYDRDLPLFAGGQNLAELFPPDLLSGGYRKKYGRALSRLTALARVGQQTAEATA